MNSKTSKNPHKFSNLGIGHVVYHYFKQIPDIPRASVLCFTGSVFHTLTHHLLRESHSHTWIVTHVGKYHKTVHTNTTLKLSAQDNCSESTLVHISSTCTDHPPHPMHWLPHALTPPWLCWPLSWGEGACCVMVWIHSPCVKSFPASVTMRGKWGCVGWPVVVGEGVGGERTQWLGDVGRTQHSKHSSL